jgi:hypothetical protein
LVFPLTVGGRRKLVGAPRRRTDGAGSLPAGLRVEVVGATSSRGEWQS